MKESQVNYENYIPTTESLSQRIVTGDLDEENIYFNFISFVHTQQLNEIGY